MGWYEEKEKRVAERRAKTEALHEEIKVILAPHMLIDSPPEIDRYEASDVVYKVTGRGDVAIRIRKAKYYAQYPFDVTVRSENCGCKKTELDKIVDGKAHIYLYGFATEDGLHVASWVLLDVNGFRAALFRGQIKATCEKPNFDGTSFQVFDVRTFMQPRIDPPIVIASSVPIPSLPPKEKR